MARYIDAEKLKERMLNYYDCVNEKTYKSNYNGETLMAYEVADMIEDCIDNEQTADVVEVVRCKDCKYFSEFQHCGILGFCEPDEYCSRGERRKEDADET